MPANTEEPRATLFGRANAGEAFGPMPQNKWHAGQRLHIVDDGRTLEETRYGREGWFEFGKTLAALE